MAVTRAYKNATNFQERKTATPLIINGDMAIAQRGTSVTGVSGYTTVDRFRVVGSGDAVDELSLTHEQSTDSPDGFANSYKITVSTPETTLAAEEMIRVEQRLEGQNLQLLKKGTSDAEAVTLSFYVKGSVTGTYIVNLHDNDNDRVIAVSYTINSANTWEKKVLSFAGDTTGTLDNDNARSLSLYWYLGNGTDWTSGTLGTSWAAFTRANVAVGQTDILTTSSATWQITGVQLEVGTFDANSIPPFQFEDRTTSLARCQRYYWRWSGLQTVSDAAAYSTTAIYGHMPFGVTMRSAPSMSVSDTTHLKLWMSGNQVPTAHSFAQTTDHSTRLNVTAGTARTQGHSGWIAIQDDSSYYVEADAEL